MHKVLWCYFDCIVCCHNCRSFYVRRMDDDQDDVVPLSRTATACSAIEKLRDLMRDPAVTGSPQHPRSRNDPSSP